MATSIFSDDDLRALGEAIGDAVQGSVNKSFQNMMMNQRLSGGNSTGNPLFGMGSFYTDSKENAAYKSNKNYKKAEEELEKLSNNIKDIELQEEFVKLDDASGNLSNTITDLDAEIKKLTQQMLALYQGGNEDSGVYKQFAKRRREAKKEKETAEQDLIDTNNKKDAVSDSLTQKGIDTSVLKTDEKKNELAEEKNKLTEQAIEKQKKLKKIQEDIAVQDYLQNKRLKEGLNLRERIVLAAEKLGVNTRMYSNGISEINNGFQQLKSTFEKLSEPWAKMDQKASDVAKHIGLGAERYDEFRARLIQTSSNLGISAKFGISVEDQMQAVSDYQGEIGRQVDISNEQQELAGAGLRLNDKALMGYMNSLENFGMGADMAMNKLATMFKGSNKAGLAFNKTSENFLKNIKLAQNYTFKKGVDGLSEMAKRAAEIKINLSEVSKFVDKTSTLEGSLKTAASLSVLGGQFATGADPISMLYNGLNDFEGAQKQMEEMLRGLVYYDSEKKQLNMSSFNRQRVKAASEAMGVNYDEMMTQAFAIGREERMKPMLSKYGIDSNDDRYQTLINRAYLDEGGNPVFNIQGKETSLNDVMTHPELMSALTRTDFSDSDNLRTITETILGWDDRMKGYQEGVRADKARNLEVTGIGKGMKGVIGILQEHTQIIATISQLVQGISMLMATGMMFNGLGNVLGSFGLGTGGAGAAGLTASQLWKGGGGLAGVAGRGAAVAGIGAVGAIGGILGYQHGMDMIRSGDPEKRKSGKNWAVGSGIIGGAITGASVGATLGGGYGALAGAILGGIGGGIYTSYNAQKEILMQDASTKAGFQLQGDYSNSELKAIIAGDSNAAEIIRQKEGLTTDEYPGIPGMKQGGIVRGIGTGTSDSNIARLSKGEYVMPAEHVMKPDNMKILESMRSGDKLIPSFSKGGANISPSDNSLNVMKVNKTGSGIESPSVNLPQGPMKVTLSPLNINGTIKLDVNGNTRDIDSDQLLNNPMFIKQLTDMISKNLNRQRYFGYEKNEYYKKF